MGDEAVEIEGYDGVDDTPSYSPSPGRRNVPNPGRRGGRKNLSAPPQHRGRRSRSLGRSFSLNINPRQLAGAISGMLAMALLGVIAVAGILYFVFTTYRNDAMMTFYGALAAAMVFVLLLAYVGIRLLGSGE
jgi:hypothetical protein